MNQRQFSKGVDRSLPMMILLLLSLLLVAVHGRGLLEDQKVVVPIEDLPLTPANQVQYITGYFEGEGYIDLTSLVFSVKSGGNNVSTTASSLDVAVVRVPTEVCSTAPTNLADVAVKCPKSKWMEHVGVGAKVGSGWWWCCNSNLLEPSCPDGKSKVPPHLMIDSNVLDGTLRHVDITNHNATIQPMQDAQFLAQQGGYFTIIMANCDERNGQPIDVNGDVVFVSLEESVEEMVAEEVPFFALTSIAYLVLFFWFGNLMHQNKESRIRLEEWIFCTIAIGFAEVLLRFVEYSIWQHTGRRSPAIALFAAVAFGAKHGVFRGLLVLLCNGVSVTHDTMERLPNAVLVTLTSTYVVLSTTIDYLKYAQERRAADITGAYLGGDLAQILWYLIVGTILIDLVFLIWIPKSLLRTMEYLRETNQERKLLRFTWIYRILLAAVGLSMLVFVAAVMDIVYDGGQLNLNLAEINEINVFLILLMVSLLWRPNPMAREYAYVTEMPTEDNDLELTDTSVVPSSPGSDFKSFPIESAEAS
eukprot:scaffold1803_cov92-Amphora_coffeaeformis.AAC.88